MSKLPNVFSTVSEITRWRRSTQGTIGFVPTMGALHEGHATLLRKSRLKSDHSVLSIFVNPTQFGPNEDFSRYPRTFENDLRMAAEEGVDVIFAPTPDQIYPNGYTTFVEETSISQPLCGKFRSGHFRGVTTIVLKLFNLVRPDFSLLGLKDAQQFFVLNKMVQDLNLDIRLEGIRTVREADGLALSSRNAFLTLQERTIAPSLYEELQRLHQQWTSSQSKIGSQDEITHSLRRLSEVGFRVQYLECVSLPDFSPIDKSNSSAGKPTLIAISAYLGKTRLIDNILLYPEKLLEQGIHLEST